MLRPNLDVLDCVLRWHREGGIVQAHPDLLDCSLSCDGPGENLNRFVVGLNAMLFIATLRALALCCNAVAYELLHCRIYSSPGRHLRIAVSNFGLMQVTRSI